MIRLQFKMCSGLGNTLLNVITRTVVLGYVPKDVQSSRLHLQWLQYVSHTLKIMTFFADDSAQSETLYIDEILRANGTPNAVPVYVQEMPRSMA